MELLSNIFKKTKALCICFEPKDKKEFAHVFFCIVTAAGLAFAWGTKEVHITNIALFPLLLSMLPTRAFVFITTVVYYFVSARGLIIGGHIFFNHARPFCGLLLLFLSSILLSLPWTLLWHKEKAANNLRAKVLAVLCSLLRIVLIQAIIILPPLGIFGWGNPIVAAGELFPGMGFYGLFLLCVIWALCFAAPAFDSPRITFIVWFALAMLCSGVCNFAPWATTKTSADEFKGYETHFGKFETSLDFENALKTFERHHVISCIARDSNRKIKVLVFPELVAGYWGNCTQKLYHRDAEEMRTTGKIMLIGASDEQNEKGYVNQIKVLGAESGCYTQRYPMFYTMWRPWNRNSNHCRSDFLGKGIMMINGKKCAMLICYEAYIVMPVLLSMLHKPQVIICCSNSWWCGNSGLIRISEQNLEAWSKLFGLPVVSARNLAQ